MEDLTLGERKALELTLAPHNDQPLHCVTKVVVNDLKKKKAEERFVIIGKHRVYIFKQGGKLAIDFHFLDITEVTSATPTQITFKTKAGSISIDDAKEETITNFLKNLYSSVITTFPGIKDTFPLNVTQDDRLKSIHQAAPSDTGICAGFANSYEGICDYHGTPSCQDISWDINNLYAFNDVTEFNMVSLSMRQDRLGPADMKALLQALYQNTWFTALVIDHLKPEKEIFTHIAEVFQYNKTIRRFSMRDSGAPHTFYATFATALSANPDISLRSIDFSGNAIENKDMITFASAIPNLKQGLVYLNLSGTGVGPKGMTAIANALSQHEATVANLTYLSIGGCKLDAESCKAFSSLLTKANKLTDLDLSGTSADFHLLKKCDSLTSLDVSNNRIVTKDSKHLDFLQFLKLSPKLIEIDLSNTGIPAEILKATFDEVPNLEWVDLSDNNLGDAGLISLCDALKGRKLKHLIFNHNFDKKTKQRTQAINDMIHLLSDESSLIQTVHLKGSSKAISLKDDILPFIFSLMTNKSIKELDITGNQIGNSLALGLSKALQANKTLETLIWDDNGTTQGGFQMIRMGLNHNTTLKDMPLPLIDITSIMKDKFIPSLNDTLKEIQQILMTNAMVHDQQLASKPQQPPQPVVPATQPSSPLGRSAPSRPQRSSKPLETEQDNTSRGKYGTLRASAKHSEALQVEQQATEKKKHPVRVKPYGIDTMSANQLYGQLNSFLKNNNNPV